MKLSLITLVLSVILLSMNMLKAQPIKQDAVYLKNGSILRGRIIENEIGRYTKIEIVGSNIVVIPEEEIDHLLLREKLPFRERESKPAAVEVTPLVSIFGGSASNGGFTTITSYRFPCRVSVGAGIGVEWFKTAGLPVFADVRYNILKGGFTPFIYSHAGFALPLATNQEGENTKFHGGPLFGAGIGLRKDFANRNAFIFSIGYRYQQTKTVNQYYYWWSEEYRTERIDKFNRIALSVGIVFN